MEEKYFVYAIKSLKRNYIYVGITNNIDTRLRFHNLGYNSTTKPYKPFQLVFLETSNTRKKARSIEKVLKSGFGKEYLKTIN